MSSPSRQPPRQPEGVGCGPALFWGARRGKAPCMQGGISVQRVWDHGQSGDKARVRKGWERDVFHVRWRSGKGETAEQWNHGERSEDWNLLDHQKRWIKSCCTKAKATPKNPRENTGGEGSSQFNRLEIWLACRDATSEQWLFLGRRKAAAACSVVTHPLQSPVLSHLQHSWASQGGNSGSVPQGECQICLASAGERGKPQWGWQCAGCADTGMCFGTS